MAEISPLDTTLNAFAQALDAARVERDQLQNEVAVLIERRDRLATEIQVAEQSLESVRTVDAVTFYRRCIDAGFDRLSVAELHQRLAQIRDAEPAVA